MLKKINKLLSAILIFQFSFVIILVVIKFSPKAIAATGYQGYAVGRDGAVLNLTLHNALMRTATTTDTNPVIHITGFGSSVIFDSWANFVGSNVYYGCYKPNSNPSSTDRDKVLVTAGILALRGSNITYTALGQIDYPSSVMNNPKVLPADISSIRCDGVVEYCNEYNNIRITGSNAFWNISIPSTDTINEHLLIKVTPSSQLANMTFVGY